MGETWQDSGVELEQMDASEIYARRLNAKEVLTPMSGEKFIFPIADGTVKLSGGDQDLRTPTSIQDRPDRGEEQGILLGESDEFSSNPHQQSSWYDGEARNDFRSISDNFICRHHVEPRIKLYVRREESFPIRRHKKYRHILGCIVGKTLKTIGTLMEIENCQMHGQVSQDSPYLLREKPPDGHTWSGKRLTRKQTTSRPDTLWPEMWKHMWAIEKPKLENARRLQCIYLIEPDDEEFKCILKNARRRLGIPMSAAMSCKLQRGQNRETCRTVGEHKTKDACIVETDESMKKRMEGSPHKNHEDHIAGKGKNSLSHYNLVHKFIPMPQVKIPDAKAAVEK